MAQADDRRSVEQEIEALKLSIEKHLAGQSHLSSEVAADLTKAIQDLSDHLMSLHRRIEKIEEAQDEWTTRGWMPPPGSDRLS